MAFHPSISYENTVALYTYKSHEYRYKMYIRKSTDLYMSTHKAFQVYDLRLKKEGFLAIGYLNRDIDVLRVMSLRDYINSAVQIGRSL